MGHEEPFDEYLLCCEQHPCPYCGGATEIMESNGAVTSCRVCNGSGVDPAAKTE